MGWKTGLRYLAEMIFLLHIAYRLCNTPGTVSPSVSAEVAYETDLLSERKAAVRAPDVFEEAGQRDAASGQQQPLPRFMQVGQFKCQTSGSGNSKSPSIPGGTATRRRDISGQSKGIKWPAGAGR